MKTPSVLFCILWLAAARAPASDAPRSWIDPDTGHRVVQLSTEPRSACLYFTQYGFTAGGTKLLMTTPKGIDLVTVSTGVIEHVYDGKYNRVLQTGRKTGAIYYTKEDVLYALDPVTRQSRAVAKAPPHGSLVSINADETLVAGAITEGSVPAQATTRRAPAAAEANPGGQMLGRDSYPGKVDMMEERLNARLPMTLFTINLQDGKFTELHKSTDWLNHFQFSPTDPQLLMFCHEGKKVRVDRIWLIRADGHSQPVKVHQRTMKMEVAGHEYWSNDGQWIWYDLQTPVAEVYWIAGYNVYDSKRIWYHLPPGYSRSVHYNSSPDGKLFSGDGSRPNSTFVHGDAKDTQWMFLFRPQLIPEAPNLTPDQAGMISPGTLTAERLVNLTKHDYSLEPNGNFTPDGKWLIFRSNMRGPIHVYAVEVAKASGR